MKRATGSVAGRDPVRDAIVSNQRLFGVAFLISAAVSVLALTVSLYMLQVYDRVLSSGSEETLLLLTLVAVGCLFAFGMLDSLRLRLLMRIGMRIGDALGTPVLRAMVSAAAIDSVQAQRQASLRDVESVRNFFGSAIFASLLDAPFLVLFLVILLMLHWAFFLIVLVGGAVLASLALLGQMFASHRLSRSLGQMSQAHSFAEEGVSNAEVLEGMGMSQMFVARWRRQWLDSLRMGLAASDREVGLTGASKAVRQIIQVLLLGAGALLVLSFHASGGVMVAASILGGRALAPVEAAVGAWKSIVAVRLSWARLNALLTQTSARDESMPLPPPRGTLDVQRVSYFIKSAQKPILANISFSLPAGESLGVIGPSASGKSSLLRLLVGAWPCSGGIVRLDGADIYAWPRAALSPYIGYLPQDVELFSGTVRDNISRLVEGDPEAIVRAAQLAHAHDMILALPQGYDTEIGPKGHALSGGQRQRIGLARALYGDPRFVVLDEPNANLDWAGEAALLAALAQLKQRGVTTIIAAHRPMILDRVDKILVLREGVAEAFGPRTEIMQRYLAKRGPAPALGPAEAAPTPNASGRAQVA